MTTLAPSDPLLAPESDALLLFDAPVRAPRALDDDELTFDDDDDLPEEEEDFEEDEFEDDFDDFEDEEEEAEDPLVLGDEDELSLDE